MRSPVRVFEGRFGRLQLSDIGTDGPEHEVHEPTLLIKHSGPDGEARIGGQPHPLSRGTLFFLNPGDRYTLRGAPDAPTRVVLFEAAPDWLEGCCPALFEDRDTRPFTNAAEDITPRLRQLADTLAIEVQNDQFLSAERLGFMMQELVLSSLDAYHARRAPAALWRGSRFEDSRIRRAISLLRARPNKDLSMDVLANRVGLSRSRFYYLFQLCTGHSPREYLDMLCVETAIERLAASNQRIADVSSNLGFSAQSNFTRFFLNRVGVAPSHYRRAAAGDVPAESSSRSIGDDPDALPRV